MIHGRTSALGKKPSHATAPGSGAFCQQRKDIMPSAITTARESGRDPLGTLHREVNRVFDEVFRGFPSFRSSMPMPSFAPSLEVRESETELLVSAELPGMTEKDVELTIDDDLLTLAGEKKSEKTEEKEGVHLSERSYGSFQRSFRLPFAPDPAKVIARFENGVLSVRLPRPPEAKPAAKRIAIGGGNGQGKPN
jgi:HSP20 family protein